MRPAAAARGVRGRALVSAPERRPLGARAPEGRLGAARWRASASPEGPLRRAASAQAEPRGTACAAGVAGLARLAEAPPHGPEARTAPQPPHRGGRAAPEHRRRNRRGGGAGQGPRSGPLAGLALRRGRVPPSNGGGQLARDAPQARPWPPHYPDCRRQAGRAAAPPPRRVGRGTARRPRGRVGRALPQGARTGAPFPCPLPLAGTQKRERRRRSLWKPDRKSLVKTKQAACGGS